MSFRIFYILGVLLLLIAPAIEPIAGLSSNVFFPPNDSENISLSYVFKQPTFNFINRFGYNFTGINLQDLPCISIDGEPRLPVKSLRILLPPQSIVKDISVETSDLKNIDISDFPPIEIGGLSHSLDKPLDFLFDRLYQAKFDTTTSYPDKTYENIGIQYFRGYSILHINLYPVRYLGIKNLVSYFTSMTVNVSVKTDGCNALYRGDGYQELYNMVENPENFYVYQNYKPSTDNSHFSSTYDYVIITSQEFTQPSSEYDYSFDDLINYRQSQGLSCTYKTIEDIYLEYDGADNQEKIRNFIKDAYLNWGTTWVLLGGSVQYVPVRYLDDVDGLEPDETRVPSDLYYQCLDGSYNENGNYRYGEINDGINGGLVDLYAEVYLGRAPVKNAADISAFVEKTLVYEQSDWETDTYLHRHLAAGEEVWNGPGGYGSGYTERCIDMCTDYNQVTHGIPSYKYDITRLYEPFVEWTKNDVKDVINQGVNIINHVGHGNRYYAMKLAIDNINELENQGFYGLFYTQACHSGKLDEGECMAARWLTADKKGGFAAIMNTGYGYGSLINYDGANNRYAREFYDALFSPDEKISNIGIAHQKSKEDNIWHINEDNMVHTYYDLMLFGCPYVTIKGSEDTIAEFSWDIEYPRTGQMITFEDQSLGPIYYHVWNFGDGSTSYSVNPTHIYSREGVFKVTLTVKDIYGYSSTINYFIEVRNYWPPFAIAKPDYYYGSNFTVSFIGNESWDPDGYITSYLWNFDDKETSTEPNPIHTFSEEGKYNVRFSVTDNEDHMTTIYSTIIISFEEAPSVPVIDGPSYGKVGEEILFSAVSYDLKGDEISYSWDFGDNTQIAWTDWYEANQTCTIMHNYSSTGTYTVCVKAKDIHGCESEWSDEIVIQINESIPPVITLIRPKDGIYLMNKKILPFVTPVCIGPIDVEVLISGSNDVDRVVFYLDGKPISESLSPPYIYSWNKNDIFKIKYNLKAVIYMDSQIYETPEEIVWKIL